MANFQHGRSKNASNVALLIIKALFALLLVLLFYYLEESLLSSVRSTRVEIKPTIPNVSSLLNRGSSSSSNSSDDDDAVSSTSITTTTTTVPEYFTTPTDYRWVGNSWFPPPGVPYLSPHDIRLLFQSENTLWWGDSTGRQEYHTIYSMINADNVHSIPQQELDRNINKFKYNTTLIKGHVVGTTTTMNFNNSTNTNNNNNSSSSSIGKFDVTENMGCMKMALARLRHRLKAHLLLPSDYSVMILSVGVWDTLRPFDCNTTNVSETPSYFLEELLETLRLVSGPSLSIVWKTNGPGETEEKDQGNETLALIQTARHWFSTHKPSHMGLSDFGSAIMVNSNRAFGENRIGGDLGAHWGTEARTLSIQMISHVVMQMKQRK